MTGQLSSAPDRSASAPTTVSVLELAPRTRVLLYAALALLAINAGLLAVDRLTLPATADRVQITRVLIVDQQGNPLPADSSKGLGVEVRGIEGRSLERSINQSKVGQVDGVMGSINGSISMYFADHDGEFPVSDEPVDVTTFIVPKYMVSAPTNPWGEPYFYVGSKSAYTIYSRINKGNGISGSNEAYRFYSSAEGIVGFSAEMPAAAQSVNQARVGQVDGVMGAINGAISMYFADHVGHFPVSNKPQDVSRFIVPKYMNGAPVNPWGEPYYYVGSESSYKIFTRINNGNGISGRNEAYRFYSSAEGIVGYTAQIPRASEVMSNDGYRAGEYGAPTMGARQAALSAGIY